MTADESMLMISGLTVIFKQRRQVSPLRAVDQVSFQIPAAQTVALVGESGSGKSTIGNAILGLVPVESGSVVFGGHQIAGPGTADRAFISKHVQVVFQNPYGSLNPSRTIGETLVEPLMVHRKMSGAAMREEVAQMLERVGLPRDAAQRYPARFSGGQRQRIAIARAMINAPDLVVCDEAVSALDLSVQAQILNLLAELQHQQGLSYLFISHDIAVVRHVADQVVVLYHGRVMEQGLAAAVCDAPRHPYTRALFLAAPVADPSVQRARARARREWVKPSEGISSQAAGCPFAPRCPLAIARCVQERPELRLTASGSLAACHLEKQIPPLDFEALWPS